VAERLCYAPFVILERRWKNMSFLKVDYSNTEQPKFQKECKHLSVELLDMTLEDGNYKNRKSTVMTGQCEICDYVETVEL
jgi:hypothetical protein